MLEAANQPKSSLGGFCNWENFHGHARETGEASLVFEDFDVSATCEEGYQGKAMVQRCQSPGEEWCMVTAGDGQWQWWIKHVEVLLMWTSYI